MKFSSREKKDLFFAGIMISLAFAILLGGGFRALLSFDSRLILIFVIAFFTAGIGFLLHEIMHKYVAQNYGLNAEFKAFYPMLWLALLFSLFGFILAAPGAVFIRGVINKKNCPTESISRVDIITNDKNTESHTLVFSATKETMANLREDASCWVYVFKREDFPIQKGRSEYRSAIHVSPLEKILVKKEDLPENIEIK